MKGAQRWLLRGLWLLPVVALAASLLGWRFLHERGRKDDLHQFELIARDLEADIRSQLAGYEGALWGAAGLIHASEWVTREEWDRYVTILDLHHQHPGLVALGFVASVPATAVPGFLERARADRAPGFDVWPNGARPSYYPILFVAPSSIFRSLLGFDIGSEPRRRAAAEASRDDGRVRITAQVELMQDPAGRAGFLLLLPIYEQGRPTNTLSERRAAHMGWVYAPFVAEELIAPILARAHVGLALEVYDGERAITSPLMSGAPAPAGNGPGNGVMRAAPTSAFSLDRQLGFGGRTWRLRWRSTEAFRRSRTHHEPVLVLGLGGVITALLFGLYAAAKRTNDRALKLAEDMTAALRGSEARFRSLVDSAGAGIVIADQAGRITLWNQGAQRTFGYTAQQAVGQPLTLLMPPDLHDRHRAGLTRFVHTGESRVMGRPVELEGQRQDGTRFPVELSLATWREGGQHFFSGILTDITDRVTAQRDLLAAKEAAESAYLAKSEFLAMMSHEIRTPMNGIMGMLQIHLDSELTAEQREQVEVALHSAEALLALLNDILDLSKIESGRVELELVDFDPAQLVEQVIKLFAHRAQSRGLSLRADVSGPPGWIRGDAARVRQVLLNLVGNAVKFTEAGQVTVRLAVNPRPAEDPPAPGQPPDALELTVLDTGIGIPADKIPNLFQPFVQAERSTTRRYGGTGLGLAICKRLCTLMGGRITLDSTVGVGTRFHVWLPCRRVAGLLEGPTGEDPAPTPAPPPKPDRAAPPPSAPRTARLLLVEDNAVNRRVAVSFCRKLGLTTDVAVDGQEALDQSRDTAYDMILLDCHLPDMDGYAVARAIRTRGEPQPRIVALTASALPGDREQCLAAGMDDYLTKPLTLTALRAAFDRWLPPGP